MNAAMRIKNRIVMFRSFASFLKPPRDCHVGNDTRTHSRTRFNGALTGESSGQQHAAFLLLVCFDCAEEKPNFIGQPLRAIIQRDVLAEMLGRVE